MATLALDGVEPRSRSTDPVTSVDAGRSVDFQRSQQEVLAVFYIARLAGMPTMAEHDVVTFARQLGSTYSEQRLRSAVPELGRLGWLERLDLFKPGPSHTRKAHLWRMTQ